MSERTTVQAKRGAILRPSSLPVACWMPPAIWNVRTRKPSKPASRSAFRYSVTYMPNRRGPARRPGEGRVDRAARLLARRLLDAARHLEREDAEAVEAGVAQRLPVLGHVHAEPARAAAARGQEDEGVDDLLGRDPLHVAH